MLANPDREKRVRKRLKQIDSCLDVQWIPNAVHYDDNYGARSYEGRYALTAHYPANDPVKSIEDYEVIGWFCVDMGTAASTPLNCDEMEGKLLSYLAAMDAQRVPLKHRMRAISERNKELFEERKAEAEDEGVQRALDIRRTALNIPFVTVNKELE